MRELRFRAWNIVTQKMVDLQKITPLALDENMNTDLAILGGYGLFIPFLDCLKIMQYTGLKDKNGKEIYEGDIGFFEDYWIGDHRQVGGQGIVKWVDDGFTVFAFDEYQSDLWNMVHNYSFEVIGNIYEGIKDVVGVKEEK